MVFYEHESGVDFTCLKRRTVESEENAFLFSPADIYSYFQEKNDNAHHTETRKEIAKTRCDRMKLFLLSNFPGIGEEEVVRE